MPVASIDELFDSSGDDEIVHVTWDFGDGSYQAVGQALNGGYSHTFAVAGTYVVTLYIIDRDGALGRTQVPITVLQSPDVPLCGSQGDTHDCASRSL